VDAIAPKGGVTSRPAGRARGMAHDLTLLTMRRDGEFQLGVKTEKGVLDVAEAATRLHLHPPATVDDLLQNEKLGELRSGLVGRSSNLDRASRLGPRQGIILKTDGYHTALLFDNICTAG